VRNTIRNFFNKFNYKIIKILRKEIEFQDKFENPLTFLINESENAEFIFKTPINLVRSWGGRKLESKLNPFIDVISEFTRSDNLTYKESALSKLNNVRKCKNASDTLGVKSNYFSKISPELAVFPWEKTDPKSRILNQHKTLKKELINYLDSSTATDLLLNPKIRGEAEIKRIKAIYNSILKNGYNNKKADFEPLEGQLLVNKENKWVVLIRHGEHRIAVLNALGFEYAPILIRKHNIIRECEVNYWWQVQKKRIKEESAIDLFNNIFKGDQSAPLVNIVGYFI
jgi:hypothetical protein